MTTYSNSNSSSSSSDINNIVNHDLGLFSETISNEYDVNKMMEKIESISAAKHKKVKDAEVSEEHDPDPAPPKWPVWPFSLGGKKKTVIEGYASNDGIAHFKPEDWDGVDNVDDSGEGIGDFRQPIVDFINYLHDCILFIEQMVAYQITKFLSRGEFKEDDVDVVKKYVTWFFTICISSYVVYNWFFVMFYRNELDEKAKIYEFSRSKLTQSGNTNMFIKLFEPYITFSVFFPEYLQKILVHWAPDLVATQLNPTFQFVTLFYLTIYILYNFSDNFRRLFIDIIMVNSSDWVVSMMYSVTCLLFFMYFAYDFMWSIQAKIPFIQIFYFIKKLIYFLIVIMITPFLGGVLSLGVILYISLFVLTNSSVTIENIKNYAEEYVRKLHQKNKNDTFCQPLTFFEKVKNFINMIFEYIYTYVFETSVIFMVLWSFYDYTHNIKSDALKASLMIINFVTIICIVFISMYSFTSKLNKLSKVSKMPTTELAANMANIITPNIGVGVGIPGVGTAATGVVGV